MRFEEIMSFLAVAKHGSLTRAAEALYISQPTLSNQILSLEKELGTQLIIRNKGQRQIQFTPAGNLFIGQAEKWRHLWLETEALFNNPDSKNSCLRLASSLSLNIILQRTYKRFSQRELPINLWLASSGSIDLYRRLDNNELDIALLCGARFYNDTVSQPIAHEQLVFCCSYDSDYDRLVRTKDLDVAKEMVIIWNSDFAEWQARLFSADSRPPLETESVFLIEEFLSKKNNWSIIPISIAEKYAKGNTIRICELDNPPKSRTIYMVSRAGDRSPYYDILYSDICAELTDKPGFTII